MGQKQTIATLGQTTDRSIATSHKPVDHFASGIVLDTTEYASRQLTYQMRTVVDVGMNVV